MKTELKFCEEKLLRTLKLVLKSKISNKPETLARYKHKIIESFNCFNRDLTILNRGLETQNQNVITDTFNRLLNKTIHALEKLNFKFRKVPTLGHIIFDKDLERIILV